MATLRSSVFSGSSLGVRRTQATRGVASVCMAKKGIHPQWHPEAKVICNGQEVMTIGGTKPMYNVDVYSGNHPFYQGNKSNMIVDEGQLNKFKKRFSELDNLSVVPVLQAGKAEEVKPAKAAASAKKGKKK